MTNISNSSLNYLIPPEIKDDEFYTAIYQIARQEDIQTVLEIGSSSGNGSTEAFVRGIQENPNKPTLFCMEVSKPRFTELQKRYANESFVRCYNVSSISPERFPSEEEIITFYNTNKTALNYYPLEQVLYWLRQDIEYVRGSGVNVNGIEAIKKENKIDFFDVVLIDGSEFTGNIEIQEIYGAKYILLDDINTYKNFYNHRELLKDSNYKLINKNDKIRNGYSIFQKTNQKIINLEEAQIGNINERLNNLSFASTVFFYCCSSGSPDNTGYQHSIICLAEGLKELGVKIYSNINYWQITPEKEEYLFCYDQRVTPNDCSVVVLNHNWFIYNHPFPENLFHPDRKYITVYMDYNDGTVTQAWNPEFRNFDIIFRTHYNSKFQYPSNFKPWAFGLSDRILKETRDLPNFYERRRRLLANFRVDHPLRQMVRNQFFPLIQKVLPIDDAVDSFDSPPSDSYHYLQWVQTGRRHYPNYYKRLQESAACACFGGYLAASPTSGEPLVQWWDSWRLWESLAAGCVTFHVDFEKYGLQLPVMPENWRHYIGIDLDKIESAVGRIASDPGILERISVEGRQWVIKNYSPVPTALRFIEAISSSALLKERSLELQSNKIPLKPEKSLAEPLPIHFFTIVLNGEPFIRYHIEVFKQLPCKWHWHIVEGVADLKHDTAWTLSNGGRITDEIHHNGRSNDGTTEYLDELAQLYPKNVTVYRKSKGVFWDGKREMVNAPLANIHEECLLWQVDVDELWTVEQLCTARQMFIDNPEKTAAFYWCWYFVGENLVISTRNCYAQNPQQDWLRTWRFKPGSVWAAHEPPILVEPLPNNQWRNVATVNPFLHEETEQQELIFQHFAYVMPEQLQFKEQYYGYQNAVSQWMGLQGETKFPVLLSQYFSWVQDGTMVDTTESCGVLPIAQKEKEHNVWRFLKPEEQQKQNVKLEQVSPKIIVDGVFFQLYKTGIARVWQSLLEEWAEKGFAKHIVVLDRAGTAPKISGISYRIVPSYDYGATDGDREMLQQVCDEEGANLFISSYYTTPVSTPSVFMAYDMIPELLAWNLDLPMWREKHHAIQHASAYIAISKNTGNDLARLFPNISPESITVAHCGVKNTFSPAIPEEINQFRNKYGISKPYFILVGAGSGYKNTILFFKAFSQLYSKQGFEIVCTGSGTFLEDELRAYTSGSIVHMLQLSDEELKAAYSGSVALVYPSKYEGFGLPVLEALACGCPVITCANASIPEVAEKAAIYVNDADVNGLANALCDVQKPDVRRSLIAAGLEQAKKFSWSKMARTVSSALIEATVLPLKLGDINLIIFPDWSQPEESLCQELEPVIRGIANHPDRSHMTLLVETGNISEEDANLVLSSVTMNLLMQEDLDVSEGPEISLVSKLGEIQWQALLPRLQVRLVLETENQQVIAQAGAENIPACELDSFSQKRAVQSETGTWNLQ